MAEFAPLCGCPSVALHLPNCRTVHGDAARPLTPRERTFGAAFRGADRNVVRAELHLSSVRRFASKTRVRRARVQLGEATFARGQAIQRLVQACGGTGEGADASP